MGRPAKSAPKAKAKKRADGRRLTSLFVKPMIMDALKKAAIDEKRSVYEIVEDAARAYLKKKNRL